MSVISEMYCDVCGTKKGATNHWTCAQVSSLSDHSALIFYNYEPKFATDYDLCSHQCCAIALERWLSGRKAKDDAEVAA